MTLCKVNRIMWCKGTWSPGSLLEPYYLLCGRGVIGRQPTHCCQVHALLTVYLLSTYLLMTYLLISELTYLGRQTQTYLFYKLYIYTLIFDVYMAYPINWNVYIIYLHTWANNLRTYWWLTCLLPNLLT